MIPFMTEQIYSNIVRSVDESAPISIHLCDFPEIKSEWILPRLEESMQNLLDVVVMGRACRNAANIKNRQPLAKMYVKSEFELEGMYTDIIADELNIREICFTDDVEGFVSYSFKPQLKTVGPKFGKLVGAIRGALANIDGSAAMAELKATGCIKLDINGNAVELAEEDLLIESAKVEGYVSESNAAVTVILDTNLTEELVAEGYVREIISKIQTMRKRAGFEVMDKIVIYAEDNEKIMAILSEKKAEICSEVLANDIILGEMNGFVQEWNINEEKVTMGVVKE